MSKSVGVRIAEMISKNMNINDTIWFSDLVTLADEIDSELKESKKQGALETYKNVLDKANRTFWDNHDWQLYTRRKIKELEGVEK